MSSCDDALLPASAATLSGREARARSLRLALAGVGRTAHGGRGSRLLATLDVGGSARLTSHGSRRSAVRFGLCLTWTHGPTIVRRPSSGRAARPATAHGSPPIRGPGSPSLIVTRSLWPQPARGRPARVPSAPVGARCATPCTLRPVSTAYLVVSARHRPDPTSEHGPQVGFGSVRTTYITGPDVLRMPTTVYRPSGVGLATARERTSLGLTSTRPGARVQCIRALPGQSSSVPLALGMHSLSPSDGRFRLTVTANGPLQLYRPKRPGPAP
eukprot:7376671-Prymnesium_polylepis.1